MSRQTLLFALLFLVALVAWQLGKVELVPESAVKIENYQPDFVAKDLVTTRFDINGKRTERLESTYAEYYQILEQATFDKPVVYMYDDQGAAEWKVTAETGVLNTGDNVILRDKVHLDGLLPTSFHLHTGYPLSGAGSGDTGCAQQPGSEHSGSGFPDPRGWPQGPSGPQIF